MSEDYDARCRELAGKLRAMLDDRLGRGSDVSEADQTRYIVHSFAVRHARDLEGLQPAKLHYLAGQAGIDAWAYFHLLEEGRALGHAWGVEEVEFAAKQADGQNKEKTMMEFSEELVIAILDFIRKRSNYSAISFDYQQLPGEHSNEKIDFHVEYCRDEGYVAGNTMANKAMAVVELTPQGLKFLQNQP